MGRRGETWRAMTSLALVALVIWTLGTDAVTHVAVQGDVARVAAPVVGAVCSLALVTIAQLRPELLRSFPWRCVTGVCSCAGACFLFGDFGPSEAVLNVVGFGMASFAATCALVVVGMAAAGLEAPSRGGVVAWGYLARSVLVIAVALLSRAFAPVPCALVVAACPAFACALSFPAARSALEDAGSSESPSNLAVTNPRSFLPFSSLLFCTILLFACVGGFLYNGDLAAREGASLFVTQGVSLVVLCGLAVRARVTRGRSPRLDGLYHAAACLLVAGFCLGPFWPVDAAAVTLVSDVCLAVGYDLSMLFIYRTLLDLAAANLLGGVPVLAFGGFALNVGLGIDALCWSAVGVFDRVFPGDHMPGQSILVAYFMVFFVFCCVFMHRYGFDETVRDVAPLPQAPPQSEARNLAQLCAEAARAARLTPREGEVLELLAAGRNCQTIQSRLGLSRNTVKTHIHNVYLKLGVHSQQELIDRIEARE